MAYLLENWWNILLIVGFAFFMYRRGRCCGEHSHTRENHTSGNHDKMNNNFEMARDPVCGVYVNPNTAIKETVDGKTYYFCSEECAREFLSNR